MTYTYQYEPGAVRYVRLHQKSDPRKHKPPKGWRAFPVEMDFHPITFEKLQTPTWFVRETYIGDD